MDDIEKIKGQALALSCLSLSILNALDGSTRARVMTCLEGSVEQARVSLLNSPSASQALLDSFERTVEIVLKPFARTQ